jgi:hypothetical protein
VTSEKTGTVPVWKNVNCQGSIFILERKQKDVKKWGGGMQKNRINETENYEL